MSSAIQFLREENKDIIQKLLDEYRGLRVEDLDEMNPEYSCVICSKNYSGVCGHGSVGNSCPEHERADIDIFAAKYDFKIGV